MSSGTHGSIVHAEAEDPEMAQAATRAVATFKYLWRELTWEYRRIVPALELSAIKAAFNDPEGGPDDVEHMWLSDVEFDGDIISATLLNSPNSLGSIQEGDQVTLGIREIEDWMYAMEGRVYGGFTVQVLRARMSAVERREHDEAWGFVFPEPDRVALVPNWPAKGGGPAGDPDAEHPMSEHTEDMKEAIEKDREAFFRIGPSGLNTLHSLALGGSAAGVRILLEMGADPQMRTRSGRTALELATLMGWPRVVDLLRKAGG